MLLREIAYYLGTQDLGDTVPDGSVFQSFLPPEPADVIVLFEEQGRVGDRHLGGTGWSLEYPRMQVLVRSANYQDARRRASDVHRVLTEIRNQEILGVWYLSVEPLQSPFLLHRDGNGWFVVAFNAEATKAIS